MHFSKWIWFFMIINWDKAYGRRRPSKAIIFPNGDSEENKPKEITIELARRIIEVNDEWDLQRKFVDPASIPYAGSTNPLSERLVDGGSNNGLQYLKTAKCSPDITTVCPKTTSDTNVLFYPECIRVKRCGGCCSHMLLSCQPTEIEILNVPVSEYVGSGSKHLTYRGREIVAVEQHTRCRCDCRIKEGDCSPYQTYDQNGCRCVCSNYEEQLKCNEEVHLKYWNVRECKCHCRDVIDCSTGYEFNASTCSCTRGKRRSTTTSHHPLFDSWNFNYYRQKGLNRNSEGD